MLLRRTRRGSEKTLFGNEGAKTQDVDSTPSIMEERGGTDAKTRSSRANKNASLTSSILDAAIRLPLAIGLGDPNSRLDMTSLHH